MEKKNRKSRKWLTYIGIILFLIYFIGGGVLFFGPGYTVLTLIILGIIIIINDN